MITEPLRYAPAIVKAGRRTLTFHVEVVDDPAPSAKEIRQARLHTSASRSNPATPVERIWPALDHVDLVLVMSVKPGFSGQKFMPEVLPKCEAIKKRLRPDQRLEIDGGINAETIAPGRGRRASTGSSSPAPSSTSPTAQRGHRRTPPAKLVRRSRPAQA